VVPTKELYISRLESNSMTHGTSNFQVHCRHVIIVNSAHHLWCSHYESKLSKVGLVYVVIIAFGKMPPINE